MTLQKTTINSFSKTGRVGNIMCASVQAFMKTHQHKGTPIVERDKMPVGNVDRKASAGAEFRKGGKQMWIMSF